MPTQVTMKDLLEAGAHFGHRTRRWNPKMRPYIFTERNGIHIIDLAQTLEAMQRAYEAVRDVAADGGYVLFVGTKRQAQDIIAEQAQRAGMPYVNVRWLGGTLTNFQTIRKRVEYMIELERQRANGELDHLPKKERLKIDRLIEKLERRVGGLRNMETLPDMLFIVDPNREHLAVHEANILGLPIVALVDTNCDPDPIQYVIPSNDDAIRTIRLMTSYIADAIIEGKQMRESALLEEIRAEAESALPEQRVFTPEDEPEYADFDVFDEDEGEEPIVRRRGRGRAGEEEDDEIRRVDAKRGKRKPRQRTHKDEAED
ncbi:MAG: 30S ribosomal protein S2 [Ardenticatenia bacterium]|nr:MAG: 30S ribosomal protein S2 [Ardenticatenia bacterium]